MLSSSRIIVFIVSCIFLLSTRLWADEREAARESAGYLQAFHANALGLNSYEALIVLNESGIKPDESLVQLHRVCLVRIDVRKHRYQMLMREKREENGGRATCFTCVVNESGKQRMLACDGKVHTDAMPQQFSSPIPDLRLTGHERFFFSHHVGLFDTLNSTYLPARPFQMTKPLGKENVVQIELPVVRGINKLKFRKTWTMDTDRLVPTAYSNQCFNTLSEKWLHLTQESFEWTEKDGVQVPTSIIGQRLRTMESGPDTGKGYTTDYDATINWFSVNREFKDDDFDFNRWDSQQEVGEEIKRVATKAKLEI